jgi:hypothetical protein
MHVVPDGHDIALENLRQAVEVLVTGSGAIRARLQAAEPYFGRAVENGTFPSKPERHLCLRIGAGLVSGGEDSDDGTVAESIALLHEPFANELAADIFRLYELVAGLREDDGSGFTRSVR